MRTGKKYEPLRETRGWYYVEYHAAIPGNKYAVLQLVITENRTKNEVVEVMEKEVEAWLARYPIPIFATAWDDKENIYDLSGLKPKNHLIGYFDSGNKLRLHWEAVSDDEVPDLTQETEYLDNVYSGLSFRSYAEIEAESKEKVKNIQRGHFIIFIWLVVIPLTFSIAEFSSDLLSAIVLLYSASKVIETWLELKGKLVKSKREVEKEKEERLKNHYYYHCQMNPQGFERLRRENFEKMAKENIAKEAKELREKDAKK